MGYDSIRGIHTGPAGESIDPYALRKAQEEDEWLRQQRIRQEKDAREVERLRKEREKLRIQRTKYAGERLRVPGILRNAPEPEWQLQQWAAGYIGAPPKPPIDWDRMNYAEREKLRKYWR
jgi:hypothetical protein